MSYTLDVYRRNLQPTRSFLQFLSYISMFPQLVAGPIVRAAQMLPQLERRPLPTREDHILGMRWIACSYFKKMVVADTLAPLVEGAFTAPPAWAASGYWWLMMTFFAIQIYCDFSGYTDIARGLGRLMGIDIPENFRHPYSALGLRDFWGRWHISLSSWFRDYVYIPLGGSRLGPVRLHVSLWTTMLLSGLWHGAAWTFVLWGALHGLYVVLERLTQWPRRLGALPAGRYLTMLVTFGLVVLAWVLFRAQSLNQASEVARAMLSFDWSDVGLIQGVEDGLAVAAVMLLRESWVAVKPVERAALRPSALEPIWLGALIAGSVFLRGPGQEFIYFAF
jgi:alginate O-acetyltransferase complex protein AlgI